MVHSSGSKALPQTQLLSGLYINGLSRPPSPWSPPKTTCSASAVCRPIHTIANLYLSERLLVIRDLLLLALGRDFETLLGRVQDQLDLLDQAIFLLLDLGILFDSLLDE